MKRNLVTGGSGFLGSHLSKKLLERGEEVICIDNFFTGTKKNIEPLMNNPNFELIRHDVTEPIKIEVDQIWHLACPASPIHYQFNPIKTTKTSFLGTHNMLGLAKRVGAKFLLASTSEVYGDPEVSPQNEKYKGSVNPIGLRSCYDEGKRVAESLCFDYLREHDIEIRVARIFIDKCIEDHIKNNFSAEHGAIAKLWCTELQFKVMDECLQLFGGYGYMQEYPIARAFMDARVQRIYGGTNEIMKEIISRNL